MEFIKEEIEDMTDLEPSRIKHEDTEEQIGWCVFLLDDCKAMFTRFGGCEITS